MSTARDALLAAICAHPDEDTPRLAFADRGEYRARWRDATGRAGHWSAPVVVSVR